jgi:hypothetical protein
MLSNHATGGFNTDFLQKMNLRDFLGGGAGAGGSGPSAAELKVSQGKLQSSWQRKETVPVNGAQHPRVATSQEQCAFVHRAYRLLDNLVSCLLLLFPAN